MTGSVPTERDHQQILETIEENLGYEDVIDRIGIEERDRRIYDTDDDTVYVKQRVMQGEAAEDDPFTAMEENCSIIPPESMRAQDDR